MFRSLSAAFAAPVLAAFFLPGAALAACETGQARLDRDACVLTVAGGAVRAPAARGETAAGLAPAAATAVPGPKFIRAEPKPPAFATGEDFPVYQHSMLLDPPRYGLPAVSGNWRYYRVDGDVYRVDAATHKVIERVQGGNLALLR